jgi:hypothetical protein
MCEQRPVMREGSDLQRRYPVALALYAVLAVLAWFTMDADKVLINGNWVDLRLLPLIGLGGLAVRTILAAKADRIRREREESE